jgi:hypothetical protein
MKSNKVQYNHKIAQTDQTPLQQKIDEEKNLYLTLLEQAKRYKAQYPNNARSNFMAEYSGEFANLSAGHRQNIEQILPGKPTAAFPERNVTPSENEKASETYNQKNAQDYKSYAPYLDKVKDVNSFVYLAVKAALGWKNLPANMDTYYTSDNRSIIVNRLQSIANNHFIKTKFPHIPELLGSAIEKLDQKIKKNSDKSSQPTSNGDNSNDPNAGRPGFGQPRSTVRPDVVTGTTPEKSPENIIKQTDLSFEAQEIIKMLESLKNLKNTSPDEFKRQYDERIKEVRSLYNSNDKLSQDDKIEINARFDNLRIDYMNILYPQGHWEAGNSTFIADYRIAAQDALSLLVDRGNKTDKSIRDQIEKILNIYQKYHINKHPGDFYVAEFIPKLNKEIANWNSRNAYSGPRLDEIESLRPSRRI